MNRLDKEDFGNRLRKAREKQGLTRDELAELADMSTNYLGEIERGEKVLGSDKFIRLVIALGVSADELLCNELPSGKPYVFNELTKKLDNLDPSQLKTISDIIDAYLKNIK